VSTVPDAHLGTVPRVLPLTEEKSLAAFWQRVQNPVLILASVLVFLVVWLWMQTSVQLIPALFVPPPLAIIEAAIPAFLDGSIPGALAWSMRNFVAAFILAAAVGIPLGMLMGAFPFVQRILGPYVWVFYSTPRVAFLPIVIVALGFDWHSKVFLIFITCLFPLIINTMTGVETVDQSLIKAGKVFGASRPELFGKVVLPFALPFVMSGVRIAASRGLIALYISEIYGSTNGIGRLILQSAKVYNAPLAFAGLFTLILLSLLFVYAVMQIERWLTPWRQEVKL